MKRSVDAALDAFRLRRESIAISINAPGQMFVWATIPEPVLLEEDAVLLEEDAVLLEEDAVLLEEDAALVLLEAPPVLPEDAAVALDEDATETADDAATETPSASLLVVAGCPPAPVGLVVAFLPHPTPATKQTGIDTRVSSVNGPWTRIGPPRSSGFACLSSGTA